MIYNKTMINKERIEKINEKEYQEIFGISKATFEKMLEILQNEYVELHKQGGRKPKLSVLDKLVITLGYMKHIAFDYWVTKSTIFESIQWVEQTLVKNEAFSLPSKKALSKATSDIEVALVDVTCEIERPQKTKRMVFHKKEKAYNKNSDYSQCKRS